MREITLEELLEAGCHFGHQVTRQNPKARDFIFEARDNIHVIDLEKTKQGLDDAAAYLKDLAAKDGKLLVVGTKRQAKNIILEEIKKIKEKFQNGNDGIFYIINRWIGGTFTNSFEVAKNYKKLKDLAENLKSEEIKSKYTKKEIGLFEKERQKLESFYGGIKDMKKLPDAILIIDTHLETIAVDESAKAGVTTVGIVDTNADPNLIDYPIPSNDDAVGALKIIIGHLMDAWVEGRVQSSKLKVQNLEGEKKEAEEKSLEKKARVEEKEVKKKVVKIAKTVKKETKPKKEKVK